MDLNYLVTGELGFIGSNFLIKLLKKKNIKVYSLDFEKYSSNLKLLKILKKKRNFFH